MNDANSSTYKVVHTSKRGRGGKRPGAGRKKKPAAKRGHVRSLWLTNSEYRAVKSFLQKFRADNRQKEEERAAREAFLKKQVSLFD